MRKEFPFPGSVHVLGQAPDQVDRGRDEAQVTRAFGLIRYKSVGRLTGVLDYVLVNGFRGETVQIELMEQRVDCDLWYIKNWSFWLDLRILALTGVELLRCRNAY